MGKHVSEICKPSENESLWDAVSSGGVELPWEQVQLYCRAEKQAFMCSRASISPNTGASNFFIKFSFETENFWPLRPAGGWEHWQESSFLRYMDDLLTLFSSLGSISQLWAGPSWILLITATRLCRRPPPTSMPAALDPQKQRMMGKCQVTPFGYGLPCWQQLAT